MLQLARPAPDLAAVVACGVVRVHGGGAGVSRFPAMTQAMLTLAGGGPGGPAVRLHSLSTRPVVHAHAGPFKALGLVLQRGAPRVQQARSDALQQLCTVVGGQGAQAAGALGLGQRQLQRRCQGLLGVSPKALQRLTRFQAVLAQALRQQRLPDAEAALAAGCFDQSHLARDARQLAGAPLRELLVAAHAGAEWWPLATQRGAAGPRG